MVDPVSSEGIKQAIEKTGVEGVSGAGEADEASSAGEASFDEVLADKTGVGEAQEVERAGQVEQADEVERAEMEGVDDVDSATSPTGGDGAGLRDFVDGISERKGDIDKMLERAMNGEDMSQQEMLEMQMLVYSYSQKVELASKTVQKATSGLKRMMQVQV